MEKQTPAERVQKVFDYLAAHRAELEQQQRLRPWKDILMIASDAADRQERAATCSACRS